MSIFNAIARSRERESEVKHAIKRAAEDRGTDMIVRDCLPWRLWVPGRPAPQPRPRARAIYSKHARKWIGTVYNPDDAEQWKNRVRIAAQMTRHPYGLDEPIRVALVFSFIRPPSHLCADGVTVRKGYRDVEPGQNYGDWDNLAKAVCDALGDLGVYRNDAHISNGGVLKVWGEVEGCIITLDALRERKQVILNDDGEPVLVSQGSIFGETETR